MEKYNMNVQKALECASVNAAAVVEVFGAQEGFFNL